MSYCEICKIRNSKTKLHKIKIDLPNFSHSKYELINKNSLFAICKSCNLIKIKKNKNNGKFLNFLKTKKYISTNQSDQIKSFGKINFRTREILQYNYFKKFIKKKDFNLLDIGCFNGKLVKVIKKDYPKSNIVAYDTNKYLKKFFLGTKINFNNKLNFKRKFDYIIISHSLQYIPEIQKFIIKIRKMIKKSTIIFIQLPDLEKNIYNLLYSDQYYLLSKNFLINFANKFGFKIINIEKDYFLNEILLIMKPEIKIPPKKIINKGFKLIQNLKKLKKIKKKLVGLKGKFYIFGTTINSVFVNHYIKEKNLGFVDESNSKNIFMNKKVILPKNLKKDQKLIFTYKTNKILIKKLKKRFKKNLILI